MGDWLIGCGGSFVICDLIWATMFLKCFCKLFLIVGLCALVYSPLRATAMLIVDPWLSVELV